MRMELIEHYLSIQGEGLHAGQPAYFVRFARCNLRCAWCDSAYTFGAGQQVPIEQVEAAIRASGARYVCITGGEPLLHEKDCVALIRRLPRHHFDVETGGSLSVAPYLLKNTSIIMDWKLSSSGMSARMRKSNLALLRPKQDLIKLVTDGSAAELREMESFLRRTDSGAVPVSIQPVHGSDARGIAHWLLSLKNPRLRFNLQLHKIVWPGVERGV